MFTEYNALSSIAKLKSNIMTEKMLKNQELIKNAYAAFNARDIDAILLVMHPEVKWPRAWEGDYAYGHDEVRAYWERQWKEINPNVTPVGFRERENGTLEVEVHQLVKDLEGNVLFDGKVFHIYEINDGLLQKMDIE
jgi:ketosteroid isomerase-like protein